MKSCEPYLQGLRSSTVDWFFCKSICNSCSLYVGSNLISSILCTTSRPSVHLSGAMLDVRPVLARSKQHLFNDAESMYELEIFCVLY